MSEQDRIKKQAAPHFAKQTGTAARPSEMTETGDSFSTGDAPDASFVGGEKTSGCVPGFAGVGYPNPGNREADNAVPAKESAACGRRKNTPHADSRPAGFPPPPPPPCRDPEQVTPPMLVNEISRLFGAWMRANSGDTTGVMSQNSARLIMRHLSFCDGVSQLELVRATSLKAPTISVTLKKMEEEGLIRRETNENDQRAVRVYLTEKGRGHDEFVRENLGRADRIVMRNFSEEEYDTAKKVLLRMRENILSDLCAAGVFPDRPPQEGKEPRQREKSQNRKGND